MRSFRKWQAHLEVPLEALAGQDLLQIHTKHQETGVERRRTQQAKYSSMRDVRPSNAPAESPTKPGSSDKASLTDDGHATDDDEELKRKSDSADGGRVAAKDGAESGDPDKGTEVEPQPVATSGDVAKSVTADRVTKDEPQSPGSHFSAPLPRRPLSPGPPSPPSPGPGRRPLSPGSGGLDGRQFVPAQNAVCGGCKVRNFCDCAPRFLLCSPGLNFQNGNPIMGIRWMCMICVEYDLCDHCYKAGIHSEHKMLKIEHPDDAIPVQAAVRIPLLFLGLLLSE